MAESDGCRSGHSRAPEPPPSAWAAKNEGDEAEEVEIEKRNVLLLGPTGELVQAIGYQDHLCMNACHSHVIPIGWEGRAPAIP